MSQFDDQGDDAPKDDTPQKRYRRGGVTIPVLVIAKGVKLEKATEALNASPTGIFVRTDVAPAVGTRLEILFTPAGESDSIRVFGTVVRQTEKPTRGIGIEIDRKATPNKALQQYRALVLHAIRHRRQDGSEPGDDSM